MAIVSSEFELKLDDVTWEERKAQLAALPEVTDRKIDCSDIPELTEEEFALMRPFHEVLAELRERNKQTASV
jgi:hypothetical protein